MEYIMYLDNETYGTQLLVRCTSVCSNCNGKLCENVFAEFINSLALNERLPSMAVNKINGMHAPSTIAPTCCTLYTYNTHIMEDDMDDFCVKQFHGRRENITLIFADNNTVHYIFVKCKLMSVNE